MKAFIHNGELFVRLVPGKRMFNSTMVHEVVNRGDIFAMRVADQVFTVIPGNSQVDHVELHAAIDARKTAQDRLAKLRLELDAAKFKVGDTVRLAWWTGTQGAAIVAVERDNEKAPWRYRLFGFGFGFGFYDEQDLVKV